MTLKSLPNLITGARIGLAFAVFVLLAIARQSYADVGMRLTLAALVVFVVAALTDFIDGWLARKLNAASAIGAMLDPIADKIALVAAGFGLAGLDPGLTLWPSALMLSRELLVSGLRETGMKLPVTKLAKWKTTAQLIALGLCIAAQTEGELRSLAQLTIWLAAALTLWTGAIYLRTAIAARRT